MAWMLWLGLGLLTPAHAQQMPSPLDVACGLPHIAATEGIPAIGTERFPYRAARVARDPFVVDGNNQASEHFILYWGDNQTVDAFHAGKVLDAFEAAWAVAVEDMGHVQPYGTETYFENVYIGNSGGGAPTIDFGGGYATVDGEGFPYIVIHPDLLSYYDWGPEYYPYADSTMAHEFYHTIQSTTDAYPYAGNTGWYWEATANWIVRYVLPGVDANLSSVASYAMLPHYPLYYFDYPDTGTFIESRHYGAQIFPYFITADLADWTLVRDSWIAADGYDDPLDALDDLLGPFGSDIDTAFAEFSVRMAMWDLTDGDDYASQTEWMASYYPEDDHRWAIQVPPDGSDGWQDAPDETRPWSYGYNLVRMAFPVDGELTIGFRGARTGSRSSDPRWTVTLARREGRGVTYTPMTLVDGEGQIELGDVSEDSLLMLVVTTLPEVRLEREHFSYEYTFDLEPLPEPEEIDDEEIRSCGCGTGSAGGGWLLLLPLITLGARARRRPVPRRRCSPTR